VLSFRDHDAFKLTVRDWMTNYNKEMENFPSVALFMEMKLREAFSLPVRQEPDPFRTAVVCELHSLAVNLFGTYSSLLGALHQEMCKAIFPDFTTANDDWMGSSPFFIRTQELEAELKVANTQLHQFQHKEDFLELENKRRQYAVNFTVTCWRNKVLYHIFIRWKLCGQHGVIFRDAVEKSSTKGKGAQALVPKIFSVWKENMFRQKISNLKLAVKRFQRGEGEIPVGDGSNDALVNELKAARQQRWDAEDHKVVLAKLLFGLRDTLVSAMGDTRATLLFEDWIKMSKKMGLDEADGLGSEFNRLLELAQQTEDLAQGNSALRIQTIFRGRVSRRETVTLGEETKAAKKIQTMMRAKADRKFFTQKKKTRAAASKGNDGMSIEDPAVQVTGPA
jgi:hypothetical protein